MLYYFLFTAVYSIILVTGYAFYSVSGDIRRLVADFNHEKYFFVNRAESLTDYNQARINMGVTE